jgi:bcr-type benzoyl-CoA reductase subunit C
VNTGLNIEALEYFNEVTEDPGREARLWKEETGSKVIGFLLTDVPEELIHAAGFFPFGISGGKKWLNLADAHLQTWTCSYIRSSFAMALGGEFEFFDGLVIPQRCDESRMVMGIWKNQKPLSLMDNFRPLRQVGRPSANRYFLRELDRFKKGLEKLRGSEITDEELRESIKLYNSNRVLLGRLFDLHRQDPSLISSKELYNIVIASMVIPREKLNRLLNSLLGALKPKPAEGVNGRIKIFISGTFLEPLEIADFIEETGGTIVGDDLKNGSRYFDGNVSEEGDLMQNLVERQVKKMPSASFDTSENPRSAYLVNTAKSKQADGVLLLHLKYCEPENYDYYDMKSALEEAGIPVQKLETEFGQTSLGQLQTRVQAFMEMLGGVDLV